MTKRLRQQGDVLLASVVNLPEGAKKQSPVCGDFILALGEVTGHAHRVKAIAGVEFYEKDGMHYLVVKDKPAKLRHEEHHAQEVPIGTWKIGGVREYDHFAEEARRVVD